MCRMSNRSPKSFGSWRSMPLACGWKSFITSKIALPTSPSPITRTLPTNHLQELGIDLLDRMTILNELPVFRWNIRLLQSLEEVFDRKEAVLVRELPLRPRPVVDQRLETD